MVNSQNKLWAFQRWSCKMAAGERPRSEPDTGCVEMVHDCAAECTWVTQNTVRLQHKPCPGASPSPPATNFHTWCASLAPRTPKSSVSQSSLCETFQSCYPEVWRWYFLFVTGKGTWEVRKPSYYLCNKRYETGPKAATTKYSQL